MESQLRLLDPPEAGWHLSDTARDVGRRGVAQARQALQEARRSALTADEHPTQHAA